MQVFRAARARLLSQESWRTSDITAVGESATTVVSKDSWTLTVDEPVKLGGKDSGANPLTYFLASIVGCSQYTLYSVSRQQRRVIQGPVRWSATGEFDLKGVMGQQDHNAWFHKIEVEAVVPASSSNGRTQEELDELAEEVERRCIVASTISSNPNVQYRFRMLLDHHN